MKHLWIGVAILAVVLLIAIFSGYVIAAQASVCADTLEQAQHAFSRGDFPSALEYVERAQAHWTSRRGLYASFLSHADTEDISASFAALLAYARLEDGDDFLACLTELQTMLAHIIDMDRPLYHNILAIHPTAPHG